VTRTVPARSSFALLFVLSATACGSSHDAAGVSPHDAATSDAGTVGDAPVMDASSSDADAGGVDARPPLGDPCVVDGGCPPGQWVNVTPGGVDLTDPLSCGNYGTETVVVDPVHPERLYTLFMCQGIWKSGDYGQTWTGPINTGQNGAMAGDCAGGITIAPGGSGPPTLYAGCIRGNGTGFSRSTNGGVDWEHFDVAVQGANGQFYPPVVDPYDPQHLLISGHGVNVIAESTDGGQTWRSVTLDAGMNGGATWGINFIDTGDAQTTRGTWLSLAQATGGTVGTWRTTQGGAAWTQVETNEHLGGVSGIYQPDKSGVVYMAGLYSKNGYGVFRSQDYGVTWTHLGATNAMERVVFGTSRFVYAMNGNEVSGTGSDPALQVSPVPGLAWTSEPAPAGMDQGPFEAATTNDGTHDIVVLASWTSGLWRFVEPTP
jgi:hypothetical protein